MSTDQPTPLVFLDAAGRPYKAMVWGGHWWLFYWHEGQKSWVSLRKVEGAELRLFRERALPPEQARLYDDLHAQFEARTRPPQASGGTTKS